jgi:hypothetical protein
MSKVAAALLFLWLILSVLPAFAGLKGAPACCTDCVGGMCPIKKSIQAEKASGHSCHKTADSQRCKMRSTGCNHDKPQLVFWYDGIVPNEECEYNPLIEPQIFATLPILSSLSNSIDPPPPKQIL